MSVTKFTTYDRLEPNSARGECIKITTTFTSYNQADIDIIENACKIAIGLGLQQEVDVQSGEVAQDE